MIKANELRRGNIVNAITSLEGAPLGAITVSEIHHDGVESTKYMEYAPDYPFGYCVYPFEGLDPIPLTPEILVKCGFIPQEGYDFPTYENQLGDRISLDGGIYKYWLGGMYADWAEIRALHRLQNFYFEYNNQELEVKL